jgi:hypothetical protein
LSSFCNKMNWKNKAAFHVSAVNRNGVTVVCWCTVREIYNPLASTFMSRIGQWRQREWHAGDDKIPVQRGINPWPADGCGGHDVASRVPKVTNRDPSLTAETPLFPSASTLPQLQTTWSVDLRSYSSTGGQRANIWGPSHIWCYVSIHSWVPGLFLVGKATWAWRWPPTPAEVKVPLLSLWAFMACSRVKFSFLPLRQYSSLNRKHNGDSEHNWQALPLQAR